MIRRLLLVDDDPDDQFFFQQALGEIEGTLHFTSAKDGVHALEVLADMMELPEIIFLDNNMPRMNGLELLEILKSEERFKNIPIVLYSTSGSPAFQQDCSNSGALAFIQKPNSLTELVELLAFYLSKTNH